MSIGFESDEPGSEFECSVDGAAAEPCTSPVTLDLADGEHTLDVTATDAAGNADATPAEATWTMDKRVPVASWVSGPPADHDSFTAEFEFASDESGSSFACKLDEAGAWTECTSGDAFTVAADGSHTLSVRATDAAGNTSEPISKTWNVDTDAPETTLGGSGPNGATSATSAAFTFTTDDGTGFECRLDDALDWTPCSSGVSFSSLADGPHTFRVRARDAAGNRDGTPATRPWTVDTQAPDTQIDSAPTGRVSSANASIAFSSNEGGATFACRVDGGAWQSGCSSPRALTGLSDGTHTVEVRAERRGRQHRRIGRERDVDRRHGRASTVIDSGPDGATRNPDPEFVFSSSEDGTFECRLDAGGWGSCISPKRYTGPRRRRTRLRGPRDRPCRQRRRLPRAWRVLDRHERTADADRLRPRGRDARPRRQLRLLVGGPRHVRVPRRLGRLGRVRIAALLREPRPRHARVRRARQGRRRQRRRNARARAPGRSSRPPLRRARVATAAARGTGNGGGSGSGGGGSGGGAPASGISFTVGLREGTKTDAADAWLTIDSGDLALKSATVKLPKGLLRSWRTATPGSVGNLQIRSKGGSRVLRNLKLKLKKAGRKPVLVSSGGVRVVLTYSATGTLKITGLPSGSTRVLVTLKGGPLCLRARGNLPTDRLVRDCHGPDERKRRSARNSSGCLPESAPPRGIAPGDVPEARRLGPGLRGSSNRTNGRSMRVHNGSEWN